MTPDQAELIQSSFASVDDANGAFSAAITASISARCPGLSAAIDLGGGVLSASVSEALAHIIGNIHTPDAVADYVASWGEAFVEYGVKDEDYAVFGEVLNAELERALSDGFAPHVREAWSAAWMMLSGIMRESAFMKMSEPEAPPTS